ncbi:extracellular exo-alpha-L-arabinofuranosidase [Abditibacteriota bacterium]|nr:extracellular exo-alpha-L-arabinofuranosidase [Abditibacteriota bacterium]
MKKLLLLPAVLCGGITVARAADTAQLTINANQSGAKISPLLYGIFYEEINRAGDGGLYAEMLENRSFEDANSPVSWNTNGKAVLSLDTTKPLNPQNKTALKVVAGAGGGAIQAGFKGAGLFVQGGQQYNATFYARGAQGPLEVHLEDRNGSVLAKAVVNGAGGASWKKYGVKLVPTANTSEARLVVQSVKGGTFYLDQVSLMPEKTWKNVPLRPDLANRVAEMKPAFVRFPGGCFVEGDKMANATRWKETIGDPAWRPGHFNLWGYRSTDGLGAHEFFQWCENMGAEPLYVINCGMAHADHIPMDQIPGYVQDALDIIEYARGPVTSKYGAMRAKNGHPAPFKLRFMEVGNENGGALYAERYALFYKAIKAKYPDMTLIANDRQRQNPMDVLDEHYYNNPTFFRARANMYDNYDRKGPKIYVGEYAVTQECGKGNMAAALGEAAYMTGLERNADVVIMASYAPLLVNPDWAHWNPNAIVFDQSRSYGTPSYWTQVLFSHNRGDVVVPSTLKPPAPTSNSLAGGVGLGTWATQAEFKDIRVEHNGKVLFQSDLTGVNPTKGWRLSGGDWKVKDGVLTQSSAETTPRAFIGDKSWGGDYTLTLKARKTGGNEGFLISFQSPSDKGKHWWNLGGWGNSQSGLEEAGDDRRTKDTIETGRWYDIKIETAGNSIKCYLDGKLIQSSTQAMASDVFSVVSRSGDGKNWIIKLVNASAKPVDTSVAVQGLGKSKLAPSAQMTVLKAASSQDENTFERPNNIVPVMTTVPVSANFKRTLAANSITILRLKAQ